METWLGLTELGRYRECLLEKERLVHHRKEVGCRLLLIFFL